MKTIEKFSAIFLIAGVVLFGFSILTLAWLPVSMVEKIPEKTELAKSVPPERRADYSTIEEYRSALFRGRDIYIREACWHCHSQYVRPTANENLRYGPVSLPGESQNALNLPQLFGTRRVGPDLSRESGKKTDDWHYAHLYKPTSVVPQSVMPAYPWFFTQKDNVPVPNSDGKAIVAYLQWIGSEFADRKETVDVFEDETLPPRN